MGKFSPTKLHGDCEEIANPSTAYGRRRRNWIDAHGRVREADRELLKTLTSLTSSPPKCYQFCYQMLSNNTGKTRCAEC
jgi:hypothetical protein